MIVQPVVEPMDRFAALRQTLPPRPQVLRPQLEAAVPAELAGHGAAAVAGVVRPAARGHHLGEHEQQARIIGSGMRF